MKQRAYVYDCWEMEQLSQAELHAKPLLLYINSNPLKILTKSLEICCSITYFGNSTDIFSRAEKIFLAACNKVFCTVTECIAQGNRFTGCSWQKQKKSLKGGKAKSCWSDAAALWRKLAGLSCNQLQLAAGCVTSHILPCWALLVRNLFKRLGI